MSNLTSIQAPALARASKGQSREASHHLRVRIAIVTAVSLVLAIAIYGASYYMLPIEQRPFSDKHELLKPSGTIGLKLGMLGTVLFFIIFLYGLRKVIPWLGRIGTARHWMDFHVIAGITAPILVAFHASFKFQGIAGAAFWIMLAVALSGFVGRYLYAQIPRSLSAAELSLTELTSEERELADALVNQRTYSAAQMEWVLRVPSHEHIRSIGVLHALVEMIVFDLAFPFRIATLRRASCNVAGRLRSLGGLLSAGNAEVESVVRLVRQKARLSKRVVFLDKTQKVFHLWHVIHRPFSYTFAILAVIHIAVVMGLGFAAVGFH